MSCERGLCFRMEDTSLDNFRQRFSKNFGHLSYIQGDLDGIKMFEPFFEFENLQTFLPVTVSHGGGH